MKSTKSLETNRRIWTFVTYFFLILGALIMVFPFVWMILTSSKTVTESMAIDPRCHLPRQAHAGQL